MSSLLSFGHSCLVHGLSVFNNGTLNRHIPLQKLLPHVLELPENEELYKEVLQRVSLTEVGHQCAADIPCFSLQTPKQHNLTGHQNNIT